MPRYYKRKTNRIRVNQEQLATALDLVLREGRSIRSVADDLQISRAALHRHVSKARCMDNWNNYEYRINTMVRKVFSEEQERMLSDYLKQSSQMHYGLTHKKARELAYQYAKRLGLTYPKQWDENNEAGREWLIGFLHRDKTLSLRRPEATSLSRATSFNQHNVSMFYSKLKLLLEKYEFSSSNIFNADETAVTTAHKPPRVITIKGQKQVGQVTSCERGQLVTMLNFINASGNALPPVFVFPRVKAVDHMLINAPPGSLALAHKSGWMTRENFLISMKHFIKHSRASVENPILLLLDNHDSHISIDVILEAKSHGVHMLTFPPHCSHRLQPLDVAVYGPFKARYNVAATTWMTNNPGKTISIYNISELAGLAFNKAMTRENILSAFRKTGIQPFNADNFSEEDFLMSSVTDRPATAPALEVNNINADDNIDPRDDDIQHENGNDNDIYGETTQPPISKMLTPQDVKPFPKAMNRKNTSFGRKRGSSRILTETPEKEQIEQEQKNISKKKKIVVKKLCFSNLNKKQLKNKSAQKQHNSRSESEDEESFSLNDDSDDSMTQDNFDFNIDHCEVDDYLLVKFALKKSSVYYVGKVLEISKHFLNVKFMRRRGMSYKFDFPVIDDISEISIEDVVIRLPKPYSAGGTSRSEETLTFPIELSKYQHLLR